VALGWIVFAGWWVIVLQRESLKSLGVAFGILAATVAVSAIATALWTQHNIRIARRGKRGKSSLYLPMVFAQDTLGRPLSFATDDDTRSASEVRVVLRGGQKVYIVTDAEEL